MSPGAPPWPSRCLRFPVGASSHRAAEILGPSSMDTYLLPVYSFRVESSVITRILLTLAASYHVRDAGVPTCPFLTCRPPPSRVCTYLFTDCSCSPALPLRPRLLPRFARSSLRHEGSQRSNVASSVSQQSVQRASAHRRTLVCGPRNHPETQAAHFSPPGSCSRDPSTSD